MTGIELRQRRTELGLSVNDLSQMVSAPAGAIERCEELGAPLPKTLSRRIDWILANEERRQVMKANGIDECPWLERYQQGMAGAGVKDMEDRLRELQTHVKACPLCQRRQAFASTLPPLPPPPLSPLVRILFAIVEQVQRLPKWARPAAVGALLIGGVTVLRAVFLVTLQGVPLSASLLMTILVAMAIGAYGGAVGGLAYGFVRDKCRKFGRIGDYLTGIVCMYAYLIAFVIPLSLFTEEEMFRTTSGWVIMAIVGTVFGLLIGHTWFRETTTPTTPGT